MIALWLALASAGDPCRGVPVEQDEGATLAAASWSVERRGFRLAVHDGTPYLTVHVAEPGLGLEVERFKEPIVLAFDEGTQMKVFPTEGSGPAGQFGFIDGDTYVANTTRFALRAALSPEAVHQLASARVEVVRYRVVTEGRKVEVPRFVAVQLQRTAACLANAGW